MRSSKRISRYQNPLDRFLAQSEFQQSRLDAVAHHFATSTFDPDSLWLEIKAKLQKFRYPQPDASSYKKTFYEILEQAEALDVLSNAETVRDLWKCLLLKRIVEFDRELHYQKKASSGFTVRFHQMRARKIFEDIETIERIANEYQAPNLAVKLSHKMSREFRQHMSFALQSRYKGSRAELLAGRSEKRPRNEERAAQVEIFLTLKAKFHSLSGRRHLSDSFLCQLAELISANPAVNSLGSGGTLLKAISRSQS